MRKKFIVKIIIIIICVALIIYIGLTFYKYRIINKLCTNYSTFSNNSNIYYFYDRLTDENSTEEAWKKDGIIKMVTSSKTDNRSVIYYENTELNKHYYCYNPSKTYNELKWEYRIPGTILNNGDKELINKFILNPLTIIKKVKYKDKECYFLNGYGIQEYIEKDTGVILYSKDKNGERKLKYNLDSVTDEDIEFLNLDDYKLTTY